MRYDATADVRMQVQLHTTPPDRACRRCGAAASACRADRGPGRAVWEVHVAGSRAKGSPLGQAVWRRSSYSNPSGNCVEVAGLPMGRVGVRDSKDPGGPVLIFTHAAWEVFVRAVRGGAVG